MYIDFQELKERVSITSVMQFLNLDLAQKGKQYRGQCPACEAGSRSLVVTPGKGVFYCFDAQEGGDQIGLAAHILGISNKDAAADLDKHFNEQSAVRTVPKEKGLEPLSYLQGDHEAVVALEFPDDVVEAVGIGYAKKGMMRGHVAIPLRLPDGCLIGYVGVQDVKLPASFQLPESNVVPLKRKA